MTTTNSYRLSYARLLILTRTPERKMIVPDMSYPPPLPVSPLQYGSRMHEARPGIITAMGVMSIILGCLGALMSLSSIFSTFVFFAMSRMPAPVPMPMPVTPNVSVNSSTTSGGSVMVGGIPATADTSDDAMPEAQRQIVIDTLASMSNIDEQRQKHLDLLLSVSGQKVFPFGDRITRDLIRRNVTERGTLPPSPNGGAGAAYFLIGTGRLELYEDHAVFRPDGSSAVVSATTNPSSDDDGSASDSASATSPPGMRPGPRMTVRTGRTMTFNMSKPALVVGVITSILSCGLAIYLLVIGIMVMRDSLSARKLHWIYITIKIPLVIASAIAAAVVWSSFGNAMVANATPGTPPPPAFMGSFMAIGAIFGSLFGLAYPVGLIFVLMSRTAKTYYSPERMAGM
jgi:hypothetical protein